MSTFTTITQHSSESPSYSNQGRKRNKRNPDQKKRSKALTVCRWHDTVLRNPKDTTRKLVKSLELINEFFKAAGYKTNTPKSVTFLYSNNEESEREIKESIPFTIAMKKIKYLGVNLPKETKELYTDERHLSSQMKKIIRQWWKKSKTI